MRAWFASTRAFAAATAIFCICKPAISLAGPLDIWHTNASFSASGIAYGNGQFVAVSGTSLQISPDGVTWTAYISPPVLNYEGITFGAGVFMAFGYPVSTNSNGPRYIVQSSNGLNWVKVYETSLPIRGATYGNGRFVFVGDAIISTPINPLQWNEFQAPRSLGGVTFGAGRFVAVTADAAGTGNVLSSADAIIWRYDFTRSIGNFRHVAYGNGIFIATCRTNFHEGNFDYSNQGFLVSSNLVDWVSVILHDHTFQSSATAGIAFGGGNFIAAVPYGPGGNFTAKTYTSSNGLDWINRVGADGANIFCFGAGTFVASGMFGGSGRLLQSDFFAPQTNPAPSYLTIASYPGVTIEGIEGQTYRIEYTTNLDGGSNWLALTNISLPSNTHLWVDTSSPMLGRRFYRAVLIE